MNLQKKAGITELEKEADQRRISPSGRELANSCKGEGTTGPGSELHL